MVVEVKFLKELDKSNEIEKIIKEAVSQHPFFSKAVRKPDLLIVEVTNIDDEGTGINDDSFKENASVKLNLHDAELYESQQNSLYPQLFHIVYGSLNNKLYNIIMHEFAHFIDKLDEKFYYDDDEFKSQPAVQKEIYQTLWNSYIDGRLNKLTPCSLDDRIKEISCIKMNSGHIEIIVDFVIKAWNKAFTTHKELLSKAEEAYKQSKEKRP